MTVEELITAIARFAPDMPVIMCVNNEGFHHVRKAYRYEGEIVITNECDYDEYEEDDESEDDESEEGE